MRSFVSIPSAERVDAETTARLLAPGGEKLDESRSFENCNFPMISVKSTIGVAGGWKAVDTDGVGDGSGRRIREVVDGSSGSEFRGWSGEESGASAEGRGGRKGCLRVEGDVPVNFGTKRIWRQ